MIGDDELEAEDLPWAMLEATPVPLAPASSASDTENLITVQLPPFALATPPLSVLQDPREGCGGHLWQAALELCNHMDKHEAWTGKDFRTMRVLELGAGTGLAGMYAARRGADVLCTDLAVMLPVLQRNIDLNFGGGQQQQQQQSNSSSARIQAKEFCWGTDVRALGSEPFDLILAADCVYLEAAFEPLLQSLEALVPPGSHTTVLLSYQHRRKAESAFFRRLWRLFACIPAESRRGPSAPAAANSSNTAAPLAPAAPVMGKPHKVQILALRRQSSSSRSHDNKPL